jgi:hypothetical protein
MFIVSVTATPASSHSRCIDRIFPDGQKPEPLKARKK